MSVYIVSYFFKAIGFYVATLFILRLGGKRVIARLTPGEMVLMIALGSLMVHPIKTKSIWLTFFGGAILVVSVVVLSVLEKNIPSLKRFVQGKPLVLIRNGEVQRKELKEARISLDELKMQLRNQQVSHLSQVKTATLEVNGKVALELDKSDLEKELEALRREIASMKGKSDIETSGRQKEPTLFDEIVQNH